MSSDLDLVHTFREVWAELSGIGRAPDGGYLRFAWSPAEVALRDWFHAQAASRDMPVTHDGNGNLFATWSPAAGASGAVSGRGDGNGPGGVLTGSHFDSVPHGGAFDGPLGIVSAFLAVDLLRARGFRPARPITVAAFAEEEGSRFGVACLGSRLLTGAIDPARAAELTDRDGLALGDVLGAAPAGARPDLVAGFDAYVELHVEQGRALAAPVGVASAIWPHGRWRFDVEGEGNHAGTTLMSDRRDPMLTYAFTVLAANKEARLRDAHATVGRVEVTPNATNAIPSAVRGWLDARAADEATLAALVEAVAKKATERAGRDGTGIRFTAESTTGEVRFDEGLAARLAGLLGGVPILPTGAGHDAGVLSAHLPTAMLFVRNPTGVSHAPAETAADADCAAGVEALARVLEELSSTPLVDHDEGVAK
ncbi:allantoate amidohydrolase [Asanoa siamensis]|uniref:Zn-dependent hydrolase n=1 Tax=Asanoa siamensis TaxID=926357 RepID=A0ABQ4CPP6_9ACTN|nr:allantoate amidohydrolase [Asanoa siamensis]GIF73254.1 Zn-dependent hydrolase [Asanoa siamensis]